MGDNNITSGNRIMDREYLRSDEESARVVEQKAMTALSPVPDNCLPDKEYM